MRAVLAVIFAVVALGFSSAISVLPASADEPSLRIGYGCAGRAATLYMTWEGFSTAGGDVYIDLGPVDGLAPGTFDTRSVAPNQTGYSWTGLDAGVTYYVRVNQQIGGQWRPSGISKLKTPCTGKAAPETATFKVVAFSDQYMARGKGLPAQYVASGGTMTACPARMVIYVEITGLDDPQEFSVSWVGPTSNRGVEFVVPEKTPLEPFVWVAPQGGYKDGTYTFRLQSGAGSSRMTNVEGSVNLVCGS